VDSDAKTAAVRTWRVWSMRVEESGVGRGRNTDVELKA
jgi:hypothetical protein